LAAEQALLGPDAYEAFHSATRAERARGCWEQVAAMTQFSTTPMTGEQSQQLVTIDGASERRLSGRARTLGQNVDGIR